MCSLLGCSSVLSKSSTADAVAVDGNWSFTSTSSQAVNLPQISGSLAGNGRAITGVFHAATAGACVDTGSRITVSGSADASGNLTLTSAPFASGSVLSIQGQLAEDGKSISKAVYGVNGGACAFAKVNGSSTAPAVAMEYQAISGSYVGSFVDADGNGLPVTATLTQTSQPDANGTFHLSGSANFASGNCIDSTVVTDSTVTGSSLSATYTQTVNGVTSTVVGSGTFNADATVLTITNWTLSGGCGSDTGTGSLTKQ
jgi:hypothetical protein